MKLPWVSRRDYDILKRMYDRLEDDRDYLYREYYDLCDLVCENEKLKHEQHYQQLLNSEGPG